jgi:hypothetical protein
MAIPSVNMSAIKDRIKELEENKESGKRDYSNSDYFPFFNMDLGSEAKVRILPDLDIHNPNIWHVERFNHRLDIDGRSYSILCPHTYERFAECPICARSDAYFKAENREKGLYYWRGKARGIMQVLVLEHDPIRTKEGELLDYAGKICTVSFTTQVMKALHEKITQFDESVDPAFCGVPTGFNFILKSVDNGGGKAQWSFSYFERNPSDLNDEQVKLIDESLKKYSELIPPRPSLEKLQHFLDAHDGDVELDLAQFNDSSDDDDETTKPVPKPEPVKEEAKPEVEEVNVAVDREELPPFEPDEDDEDVAVAELDDDDDDEDIIKGILGR